MILFTRCSIVTTWVVVSIVVGKAAAISTPLIHLPISWKLDKRVYILRATSEQGLYEQTVREASELINSHTLDLPSLGYAYCLRGNARAILNQYSEAISDIDTGLKTSPNIEGKAELYGIRANCMTALGKYHDAITSISQTLAIEPSGIAYYLRGMLNFRLKKYAAAKKDLEQAMQYVDCPEDTRQLRDQSILNLSAPKANTGTASPSPSTRMLLKFQGADHPFNQIR